MEFAIEILCAALGPDDLVNGHIPPAKQVAVAQRQSAGDFVQIQQFLRPVKDSGFQKEQPAV